MPRKACLPALLLTTYQILALKPKHTTITWATGLGQSMRVRETFMGAEGSCFQEILEHAFTVLTPPPHATQSEGRDGGSWECL